MHVVQFFKLYFFALLYFGLAQFLETSFQHIVAVHAFYGTL